MSRPTDAGSEGEHPLSLRVMRLCRPSFNIRTPFLYDAADLQLAAPDSPAVEHDSLDSGGLSDMFVLPHSFGASLPVSNVTVKAELQSNTQRVVLLDTMSAARITASKDGIDYVVAHELRELAVHILICIVSYTDRMGEKKWFKKYFRFAVLNPLVINTKITEYQDTLFLEAQIQNQMTKIMCLETVRFEASSGVAATDLCPEAKEPVFFGPNDIRQFLYRLTFAPMDQRPPKVALGKMEVVWKSAVGEPGRLQTLPIVTKPPTQRDLKVKLSGIPARVSLGAVIEATCSITNFTERSMMLSLVARASQAPAIIPIGVSAMPVGVLKPSQSLTIPLSLFAGAPGLHRVVGLQFTDSYSHQTFDADCTTDIYIDSSGGSGNDL